MSLSSPSAQRSLATLTDVLSDHFVCNSVSILEHVINPSLDDALALTPILAHALETQLSPNLLGQPSSTSATTSTEVHQRLGHKERSGYRRHHRQIPLSFTSREPSQLLEERLMLWLLLEKPNWLPIRS